MSKFKLTTRDQELQASQDQHHNLCKTINQRNQLMNSLKEQPSNYTFWYQVVHWSVVWNRKMIFSLCICGKDIWDDWKMCHNREPCAVITMQISKFYNIIQIILTFWYVITYDLFVDRCIDDIISISSILLCTCSVINRKRCQYVVRTSTSKKWHLPNG